MCGRSIHPPQGRSSLSISIKTLQQQLIHCRIADRFSLRREIDRLKRQSPPDNEKLARLAERLEASRQRVERLKALSAQPEYPDLPVSERRQELLKVIADNQVVVIAGETGSGKTTQIPKLCLELGLGCYGVIGHTQPRRLAARTVASRIAEELKTPLGERVGYQVRFHDQVSDNTQVKLMTDGILLAETQHDRFLEQYEVLIIDEAHERSLNIDFLLGYIKRILPRRPDLKVIITSATIDLERFSQHFDNAPVIEVSGRTYPVETLYRPLHEMEAEDEKAVDLQQGILAAVDELIEIDRAKQSGGPGDILVFLPGEREIRETADSLRKAQLRDTEIIPLYARLSLAEQNRVFHENRKAGRRIVLSTNVAETSLTVPGIRYVIDPGVARISRYSYRSKVQRLPVEAISQASANQRAGRCGRVAPGVCIRLYSEEDFLARPEFTDAEIRRTNLAAVILQMLQLKLGDIREFPFVDPPDTRLINDGYKLLEELGAVDDRRGITQIGRQLARLPVDPRIARMVIEASKQGALREVLVIASALSVQDPRERPHDKRQAADQKHKEYADEESDFMTLLNLWQLWHEQREELSQSQLRRWCQKQFLSFMRLREWRDVHRQLLLSVRDLGLKENTEPAEYPVVHKSLLAGLLSHIGFKQEKGEYLGARNRRFKIFPASGVFKKAPKWVMAAELLETSQLFAHQVARIEPEWIEPLAKHLVKRSWMEPHWEKKRAQVVATEQVSLFGVIIVPRRRVNYGGIDPVVSHEIFIRSALVEGEYQTQAPFFAHNRQLLESVAALEDKSRRRDLLVDEEQLYRFYAERLDKLNGSHVVNGKGFEHWRKQVEQDDAEALFMRQEDILQRGTEHVSGSLYPDVLSIDGVDLPLSYHFEPGAKDDGVTLELPLALLRIAPLQRLEWLVPGMLEEKVVAILKGLPKQLRKHFVPVPNYAEAFCNAVVFAEGDLYEALSLQLLRMTGTKVTVEALRAVVLEEHHLFNLRLRDDRNQVIGSGRDWELLNRRFGVQAEEALQSGPSEQWGQANLTDWSFGELPESIHLRQAGGIEVEAWPALIDRKDSVELKVLPSSEMAHHETLRGVARLLLLSLPAQQVKYLRRDIPRLNESLILAGKLFERKALEDDALVLAAQRAASLSVDNLPRNKEAFEQQRELMRANIADELEKLGRFIYACHQSVHRINKQLNGRINLQAVPVLNDIKQQLAELMHKHYLVESDQAWLQEFPRYLQGIEIRLDKYQRDLRQQCLWSEQLAQFRQQYLKKLQEHVARNERPEGLVRFRWLLEEYRVSLFAQQLGTRESVSEKRLKQALESF
ncbi:ATP-dependent RNA helicase HrpA [Marinobacterium sediminicola]|uniref:ATP-dependent helicase HrpA n=1 Tax=Marinobacterium sediminicola TaxID=518898 RepID=A0ABY1RX16_9GAMM|nr:ATP-dependent RNA helicase HrpA [Marinobacterium sediminicola]ULG67918.1 ATP-dependent RNA helicase HrpA [Marinobacterium sediminicola]SMR71373.1 ATP-dependent helicase HrpA [Marinobacterium sediminicola]